MKRLAHIVISLWLVAFQFDLLAQSRISATPIRVVKTLAELDALPPSVDAPIVDVLGLSTANDLSKPMRFVFDRANTNAVNRFTRATTNGVGRWVHEWDGDVRAFGVVGDEVADDTAAMQAAMDMGPIINVTVTVPLGLSCKITTNLLLSSNLRLKGPGKLVRYFSKTKPSGILMAPNPSTYDWPVAWSVNSSNILVEDLGMEIAPGYTGCLLYLDGVRDTIIRNNRIRGNGAHADWAVPLRGVNVVIEGNDIDTRGAIFQDGIHVDAGQYIQIIGNRIYAGDDAVAVGSSYNATVEDVLVANNILFSSHAHAIRLMAVTNTAHWDGTLITGRTDRISFIANLGLGGEQRNGTILIEENSALHPAIGGTNPPLRLISDILIDGGSLMSGDVTGKVNGWNLTVSGGQRITIRNLPIGSSSRSSFYGYWLKDFLMENCVLFPPAEDSASYPTVRMMDTLTGYVNYHTNVTFRHVTAINDQTASATWRVKNATRISFEDCHIVSTNTVPLRFEGGLDGLRLFNNLFENTGTVTNAGIYVTTTTNALDVWAVGNRGKGAISPIISQVYQPKDSFQFDPEVRRLDMASDNFVVARHSAGAVLSLQRPDTADTLEFRSSGGRWYVRNADSYLVHEDVGSNNANKAFRWLLTGYDTSRFLPVVSGLAQAANNYVQVGGGSGSFDGATAIQFFANTSTNMPGTNEVARIVQSPYANGTWLSLYLTNTASLRGVAFTNINGAAVLYFPGVTP